MQIKTNVQLLAFWRVLLKCSGNYEKVKGTSEGQHTVKYLDPPRRMDSPRSAGGESSQWQGPVQINGTCSKMRKMLQQMLLDWRLMMGLLLLIAGGATSAKYPNEIIDTPIVSCEQDSIAIKIRTSSANPSHIYAEDFHDTPKCMVRNQNKIVFAHSDCGMTTEHLDNPAGTMYRICLSVQIHPLFVTDSDRSYCAQCVYVDANLVDDLEKNIAISEMTPNELDPQFDEASNPQCSYSIRKGTVDGSEVHAAVVGETVFHVWQCNNENVGILVQNCHVEDLQGDKILIIDQNGCGVDQYLFRTPQYSSDLHTAYLQSSVFKFVDKSMTRFRCQLRLCVKNRGKGCEAITPPSGCPSIDDGGGDEDAVVSSGAGPSAAVHGIQGAPPSASPTLNELHRPPNSGAGREPLRDGNRGPAAPPSGNSNTVVSGGMAATPRPADSSGGSPPSIRPYGPSAKMGTGGSAQVISGKTEQPQAANNYPYYHRERRSSTRMLYGQGSSAAAVPSTLTAGAAGRARRQSAATPAAPGDGGEAAPLQELDVVGLIRVLDNPDDIQYFADHLSANSSASVSAAGNSSALPAPVVRSPRLQLSATPRAPEPLPLAQHSAREGAKQPPNGAAPNGTAGDEGTCVSTGTFRALLLALGAVLSLQLCALALVAADRFLLGGRCLGRRVQDLLGKRTR